MARTTSTRSPSRPTPVGRAELRKASFATGQQPSAAWMLTLLNATMLR